MSVASRCGVCGFCFGHAVALLSVISEALRVAAAAQGFRAAPLTDLPAMWVADWQVITHPFPSVAKPSPARPERMAKFWECDF